MSLEKNKIKWAILCTQWGRNAKDVIDEYAQGALKNSHIKLLIYESEPCGAADTAKENNIETIQLIKSHYPNAEEYQKKIIQEIKKRNIDYVFMLGYKYLIRKEMLKAFPNKIINIHPSLFPSFLGTKTAIQDALDYGVKITGITTHLIDNELDKGVILFQKSIKIKSIDTFDTLYPKFSEKGASLILKTMRFFEKEVK